MKSSKKNIIFWVVFFLVFAGVMGIIILANSNKNKILNYEAAIDIDESGNITVQETLVVDYKSYQNYIIRDIRTGKTNYWKEPYNKYSSSKYSNSKASFDKNSVNVRVYRGNLLDEEDITSDITNKVDIIYSWGEKTTYKTEGGTERLYGDDYSICIDAIDAGHLDGVMTFVYSYQIDSMANVYNDCGELNYIIFNEMDMVVKNAKVVVTLPKQVDDIDNLRGYGHGLSNGKITIASKQSVLYEAKNVKLYEDFEVRVLFPSNILNQTENTYVDVNINQDIIDYEAHLAFISNLSRAMNYACIAVTVIICIAMVFVTIHVYRKYDKEFTPDFDGIYLRELPYKYSPAIAGYVYRFGSIIDQDVTAVLLHLIYRKYLTFEKSYINTGKKIIDDAIIRLTDKSRSDLLPYENDVIDIFINTIGNGSEVSLTQIEAYGKKYNEATKLESKANKFRSDAQADGKTYNFILNQLRDKSKALRWIGIPVIGFVILGISYLTLQVSVMVEAIILGLVCFGFFTYVSIIKKRTQVGANHYARWNAFKKFLEDFSNMQDYEIPGLEIWEEYLVYATSLGCADAVMKQLKIKMPEAFDENNVSTSGYYATHYYMYHSVSRINHSYQSCRSNVHNAIAQHNASSSGGHGGGFSSGSSHGGGGGGFHGGR